MVKSISKKPTDEQNEKNLAIIARFTVVSDNSGYKYAIPVYEIDSFHKWVESSEKEVHSKRDFSECRIPDDDMLTFTDPRVG